MSGAGLDASSDIPHPRTHLQVRLRLGVGVLVRGLVEALGDGELLDRHLPRAHPLGQLLQVGVDGRHHLLCAGCVWGSG